MGLAAAESVGLPQATIGEMANRVRKLAVSRQFIDSNPRHLDHLRLSGQLTAFHEEANRQNNYNHDHYNLNDALDGHATLPCLYCPIRIVTWV
jgi:hypothetical protein